MKDLIDKLTTYNIFNYLLPGVLFVTILTEISKFNLILDNNLLGAFLYYFIGMTISRIGSVIIEPLLKRFNFLSFSDYKDFVIASKNDEKIELLSEENNTYRTLTTMLILLLIFKLYDYCSEYFQINNTVSLTIIALLLTALYLFSYRKQTNYVRKRIDANKQS